MIHFWHFVVQLGWLFSNHSQFKSFPTGYNPNDIQQLKVISPEDYAYSSLWALIWRYGILYEGMEQSSVSQAALYFLHFFPRPSNVPKWHFASRKNSSFCLDHVQKYPQGTATSSLNSATFDRLSEGCDPNVQLWSQKGLMESCGDKKQNKGLAWLSNCVRAVN